MKALNRSIHPSINKCSLSWSWGKNYFEKENESLPEIFYNELISSYKIIDADQFKQLEVTFACGEDPATGNPYERKFTANDCSEVYGSALFKMAAHKYILASEYPDNQKKYSIDYQVLSKQTAMIGVVKEEGVKEASMEYVAIEKKNEIPPAGAVYGQVPP